jgi:cephalosporin hydroxylase
MVLKDLLIRGICVIREDGFKELLRRGVRYFLHPLFAYVFLAAVVYLLSTQLKKRVNSIKDLGCALDFAFEFRLLGLRITPAQDKDEIKRLLAILTQLRPKVVLEIGTGRGGTLFLFTRVADPEAIIVSVDYGPFQILMAPLFRCFAKDKQIIYPIVGDSHALSTLNKIKRLLEGRKIDFLFIDACHDYGSVKKDYEFYSPPCWRMWYCSFS